MVYRLSRRCARVAMRGLLLPRYCACLRFSSGSARFLFLLVLGNCECPQCSYPVSMRPLFSSWLFGLFATLVALALFLVFFVCGGGQFFSAVWWSVWNSLWLYSFQSVEPSARVEIFHRQTALMCLPCCLLEATFLFLTPMQSS